MSASVSLWLRRLLVVLAIGLAACLGALLAVGLVGCGSPWRDAGCEWDAERREWQCPCAAGRIYVEPHPTRPRPAGRAGFECVGGRRYPFAITYETMAPPP